MVAKPTRLTTTDTLGKARASCFSVILGNPVKIETPNAKYVVTSKAVRVYSRLNYQTQAKEKTLVGTITWDRKRGPWRKGGSNLYGDGVALSFDDYHVRVLVPPGGDPVTYDYTPAFRPTYAVDHGRHMRLWMDDEVGFQHMFQGYDLAVTAERPSGFAALPSRLLRKNELYGERPHVAFCFGIAGGTDHDDLILADPDRWLGRLEARGFGVLVLWNHFYSRGHVPEFDPIRHYELRDDKRTNYRNLIQLAHRRGWLCLAYLETHHFHERLQREMITRHWMADFQNDHDLDGWYCDGWRMADQWFDNYDFAEWMRLNNRLVYVHNTVDVWGAWSGYVAHPQLALADYCLHGERYTLDSFDDPYFQYITRNRSGAIPDHKLGNDSAVTWPELYRVLGTFGTARQGVGNNLSYWDDTFAKTYAVAKESYEADYAADLT